MVNSILRAVREINSDAARHLQAATIERICRELNYTWRERLLGSAVTVQAFLLQVLHGNTACDHVPHRVGQPFTGTALRPSTGAVAASIVRAANGLQRAGRRTAGRRTNTDRAGGNRASERSSADADWTDQLLGGLDRSTLPGRRFDSKAAGYRRYPVGNPIVGPSPDLLTWKISGCQVPVKLNPAFLAHII